jgi:hypothetical protein
MKKAFYILFSLFMLSSCQVDYKDDRAFESAKITAVKINNTLYTIVGTGNNEAKVVLAPGVDLTTAKTELLVANGKLLNFENNVPHDLSKPIEIQIYGDDGQNSIWKLIVQSPPLLVSLDVVGLSLTKDKIHFGKRSIIVEVPEGTDVTNLAVSYEFLNGTMTNFVNGTAKDYTFSTTKPPFKLQVLGADGTTTYGYDVVFTSDPVGPAQITGMVINGDLTSEILIIDATKNIIQPVVPYLTNFSDANIELVVGFGSTVDPDFKTTNLNLLKEIKVKVTGTNGVETEFTIRNPLIKNTPILEKSHASFNFAANAGSSAGWSGNNIVIATNAMKSGNIPDFGINAYDLSGNYLNGLAKTGTSGEIFDSGTLNGIRKLATDDDGKILGVQLGVGAGATTTLSIIKWNSITDPAPTNYISYTQTSLGLASAARSAGINISGSLDGNAVIAVTFSGKTDVFVWTVTNGVLNPTPVAKSFPYTGGNYFAVQPFEDGFVGAATGVNFNGVNLMGTSLSESAKITGAATSDCKTITYKGRKYIAYVAFINGKHVFRIVDITTPNNYSLENPIMNITGSTVGNGNITVDADFKVINNKLHVLFYGTNDRLAVYKLEQ